MHSAIDHGYVAASYCSRCGMVSVERCGCEVLIDNPRMPFNLALHIHLTELGYEYVQHTAEFDAGDAENGPGACYPAYDEYVGPDVYFMSAQGAFDYGPTVQQLISSLDDWLKQEMSWLPKQDMIVKIIDLQEMPVTDGG